MSNITLKAEGRVARRRKKTRATLIEAARSIMSEKGLASTTMLEIADRADIGAGTVYNYFDSKEALALAVLESIVETLAHQIAEETHDFKDPLQVYTYRLMALMEEATKNSREQMIHRTEVIGHTVFQTMKTEAIQNLQRAAESGRLRLIDPELLFHLSIHALMGAAADIRSGILKEESKIQILSGLLRMVGVDTNTAHDLAKSVSKTKR